MADDFFSLAQLEQPQMMPNAPMGAGALAGMMYGQDKARQDNTLQQAQSLASLSAMLSQQKAQETMAGAPGRMDTINRGNQLAAGALANTPLDVDTGAEDAHTKNVQAHLARIAPYAMDYRDTMSKGELDDLRERMRAGGVTTIGTKNLDDIPDDKLEGVLKSTKNAIINTPKHQQDMEKQQLINAGWQDRVGAQGDSRETVERLRQAANISRQEMRDKAKIDAARITEQAKSGRLNMGQYRAQLYQRAEQGDDYAKELLMRIDTQDLSKAAATAANSGSHLDTSDGGAKMAPPVIPTPPPFPTKPTGAAPSAPTGRNEIKLDLQAKTATVGNKTLKLKGYNKDTGEYLLEDGSIVKAK